MSFFTLDSLVVLLLGVVLLSSSLVCMLDAQKLGGAATTASSSPSATTAAKEKAQTTEPMTTAGTAPSTTAAAAASSSPKPPPATPAPPHDPNSKCTKDLLRYDFGRCDWTTGTMHALPYFDQDCVVPAGTKSKHPAAVSCTAECPEGSFMDPETDKCATCPAGTYSTGADVHFPSHESRQGVVSWSTRCAPQPCDVWHEERGADGSTTFHSGKQARQNSHPKLARVDESVVSVLTLLVTVGEPAGGKLLFSYRTESEHCYDGLAIMVNESAVHSFSHRFWCSKSWYDSGNDYEKNASFHLSEQNVPFFESGVTSYNSDHDIALPFGTTEVRFIFRKDANQYTSDDGDDYGNDRAYIRNIIVKGARVGSAVCNRCPKGWSTSGRAGSSRCFPCPENTYSDRLGSATCKRCGEKEFSAPGSSACTTMPECKSDDYVALYTGCDVKSSSTAGAPLERMRYWRLPPDARCYETKAAVPKNTTVPCAKCPFGGYRDEKTGKCVLCEPGSQRSRTGAQGDKCEPCKAGEYGQPEAAWHDGFDSLTSHAAGSSALDPRFFTSSCFGECAGCTDAAGFGGYCHVSDKAFGLVSLRTPDPKDDSTLIAIRSSLANGDTYFSTLDYEFETSSAETGGEVEMTYFFAYEDLTAPSRLSALDPEVSAMYSLDHKGDEEGATYSNSVYEGLLKMTPDGRSVPHKLRLETTEPARKHRFRITLDKWSFVSRPPHQRLALFIQSFVVRGDIRGSAPMCLSCPRGHHCAKGAITPTKCKAGTISAFSGADTCTACADNTVATSDGLAACTPCYPGSAPNADHSWCDQQCTMKTRRGDTYDFSLSKEHVFGPEPEWTYGIPLADTDKWNEHRYFFSLCDHVPPELCPVGYDGRRVQSSIVCQRINAKRSYSLGDERDLVYDDASNKVVLMIRHGDACHGGTVPRTSNVTLVCDNSMEIDPKRQETVGTFTFLGEAPACHYNFHFTSALACRQCTVKDFKAVEGECMPTLGSKSDGVQSITYLRHKDVNCFGGAMPSDTVHRCKLCTQDSYEVRWGACDEKTQLETRIIQRHGNETDCVDNGTVLAAFTASLGLTAKTRPCEHSVESRVLPYAVVIVLIISVSLICVLISLQRKHKQLKVKYERISGEVNGGTSMDGLGTSAANVDPSGISSGAAASAASAHHHHTTAIVDDDEGMDMHPAVMSPASGGENHPAEPDMNTL